MKNYLQVLMCFLLVSCNGMHIQSSIYSSYSPFNKNAWIDIKHSLQVTPENARVYLQNGKQVIPSELDFYQVNCEIEVKQVLDTVQTVYPGRYNIINISLDESSVVFMETSHIQLAFIGKGFPIEIKKYWKFSLQSKQYPEVINMLCRGVQDIPFYAQLPTVEEIKLAVGAYIEVSLISD
jgi:hypothetical protein